MTERKKSESPDVRKERLRVALRENLKRRKAQARGRAGTEQAGSSSATKSKASDTNPVQ